MAERATGDDVKAASQVIKKHAAKNKVRIELDQKTLDAIMSQWDAFEPDQPAEVTFYVGDRAVSTMRLAACAYRGDTCCAAQ